MTLLLAHAGEFHPMQMLVLAGAVLVPLGAMAIAFLFGRGR